MLIYLLGAFLFVIAGALAIRRARAEFGARERLTLTTIAVAYAAIVLHAALTIAAAASCASPVPIRRTVALAAGGILIAFGLAVHVAGRFQFGSSRLISGIATDRLVTDGVYRYTRHPQNVGWGFFLVGVAALGRSGIALVFALLFWIGIRIAAGLEEDVLERKFGEAYREYAARTPRYLGLPRDRA